MDSVRLAGRWTTPQPSRRSGPPEAEKARQDHTATPLHPFLPPPAPLAMPIQSLRESPRAARPPGPRLALWLRRACVFLGAAVLTVFAAHEMYLVLDVGGLTSLEGVVLGLFVVLFAWIGFSFTNALGGALAMLGPRTDPLGIAAAKPERLTQRCAILMPTYNEAPARIFAGLQATYESLEATGAIDAFDFFILSDTTDPDVWVAEEAAFLALRERTGGHARLFYRRRPKNIDRKAGNIGDWVTRFGGAYETMLVLDADSVMTGECMLAIAAAMERHPHVGLLQTLPVIVGGRTLFSRMQQFAGRLYGPMLAEGLAWWHGPDSNYWGHNAIIRTRAFAACAGLPHLKGRKPFGGHILSHDFIEAALIRRGGWAVHMVPWLKGSYEEGPPSLTDLAVRDRRWCQGNLQHAAVLPARGLALVSRIHLLMGIGSYITAPLWLIMLVAGLLTALQARFVPPDYFPSEFSLFPNWPAQDPIRAAWVFIGTMAVLLLPKVIAYLVMLTDPATRRAFGGGSLAFAGMIGETLIAGLAAPVMMIAQSAAVTSILAGRDGGWNPQRRDDGTVALGATLRHFLPHTLFGLALGGAALAISLPLFLWMLPVVLGLVLAVPLVIWTSTRWPLLFRAILTTPEERAPPPVLTRAFTLARQLAAESQEIEAVQRLANDPGLLAAHRQMLPQAGDRAPGDHAPERLVAQAKIEDASSLAEALAWLAPREKAAALGDRVGLDRLLALANG